jgi:hypothetical protein
MMSRLRWRRLIPSIAVCGFRGEAETEIYVLNRVVVVAVGEKLIVACPRKEE